MMNVIVTLGSVAFQDFEVPEKIFFGGAQRVAVNQLIGGGRVVNVLGNDEGEIRFSGVFSGTDASLRAQTLDAMRAAGTQVTLAWNDFYYTVVIAVLLAEYTKPWWIPFELRCVVVSNATDLAATLLTPVASLIANDLAYAATLSGQAGLSLLGLNSGGLPAFAAAQTSVTNIVAGSGASLSAGASLLNAAPDAASGVFAMGNVMASSAQLAAATSLSGYINRSAANSLASLL